jgi:hypothetical protein
VATTVCQDWRRLVETPDEWERDQTRSFKAGGSGGFNVRCKQSCQQAWLKPTAVDNQSRWASREKIASDLAYDLEISAPAVVLHRRKDPPKDQEALVCLSLVEFPQQFVWGDFFDVNSQDGGLKPSFLHLLEQALAKYSGIVAFDAWLNNDDRKNADNVILGYDKSQLSPGDLGRFVFIDFANSMRWDPKSQENFSSVAIPSVFKSSLHKQTVNAAVDRIRAVTDEAIREIVYRIPDDFLPAAVKENIYNGLVVRRNLLGDKFGVWYPGT